MRKSTLRLCIPPAVTLLAALAILLALVAYPDLAEAAAFTVNSTGDGGDSDVLDGICDDGTGKCTLRAAIQQANFLAGPDTISFNIAVATDPGCIILTGVCTIQPISVLPTITDPVTIDGTTQPGFSGTPVIELDGTLVQGLFDNGLHITAGNSTVRGLVINQFGGSGIYIDNGDGNVIEGNFIGTDVTGTEDLGNSFTGVAIGNGATDNLIGGTDPGAGNVISGNDYFGVGIADFGTTQNVVQGNPIGTDLTGTAPLGNTFVGVYVANGATDNVIGGTNPGARNVISANGFIGVLLGGDEHGVTLNVVAGNFIGTDITGTVALGNSGYGVVIQVDSTDNLIGGSEPGAGNVISGNDGPGIGIAGSEATDNLVQGNYIGTDVSGTSPLSNNGGGVVLTQAAGDNLIGGTESGASNIIAFNVGSGVVAHSDAGSGNAIINNAIYSNQELGIDLSDDGVTSNDPLDGDSGPNGLQNFPVITGFDQSLPTGIISGTLSGTPETMYTIEFFANWACDELIHGEGEIFLGDLSVTTDPLGEATFIAGTRSIGYDVFLTATATDDAGNTSEFSRCRAAGYTVVDPGGQQLTDTPLIPGAPSGFLLEADVGGGPPPATVRLCGLAIVGLNRGDILEVRCGSANIKVVQGPIEIQLDALTDAIVPTDATVIVDETEEGELTLQNDSPEGTEPVLIAVGGEVVGQISAGDSFEDGPRRWKVDAFRTLSSLRLQLNDEGQEKLTEGLIFLKESLIGEPGDDEVLWLGGFHLSPDNGDDVFGTENDAVEKLMEILEKPDEYGASETVVSEIVTIIEDQILEADRLLAQIAIGDASSGDADLLEEANDEMEEASSAAESGQYEKAVEYYFKAWEAAHKAIGAL